MKQNLEIIDPVYGTILITDSLVQAIIEGPSMHRLKDIDMAGYSHGFYPGCGHSRFAHSVGVYHLLNRHGASPEECLHGLLHDVSHTVFSHAIDYALGDTSGALQDYQDRMFSSYIADTEIPQLLVEHGYDPMFIFDDSNFPLQERDIPELCGDRLDYSFRAFLHYGILPLAKIKELMAALQNNERQWFFADLASAKEFASYFATLDDEVFDSLRSAAMFKAVGDCVQHALAKGYLTPADLFSTDSVAVAKLEAHTHVDSHFLKLWKRMNGIVPFRNDPTSFEALVQCKSRIVDPLYMSSDGSLQKLSHAYPEWAQVVDDSLKAKTYYLTFDD